MRTLRRSMLAALAALAAALCLAAPASAITYDLVAKPGTLTIEGVPVPIWGFCQAPAPGADCTAGIPGPTLAVPPGDTTLTVTLRNALTAPVSIVIPGQQAALAPVTFLDAQSRARVRSFVAETAPGAVATYTWTGLKPGTYLYHSGTHPAVQVQMGLYGAATIADASGAAYAGIAHNSESILLYSEIDPVLNRAVAGGTYGTPSGPKSTLHHKPQYFLVNGQPFAPGVAPIPAGLPGEPVLLRFINAGLRSYVPTLSSFYLRVIAEDGNLLRYPREPHSLLLPAGKTTDALWTPPAVGLYPILDRRLHLTSAGAGGGGMLAYLGVGNPLVAVNDAYTVAEDGVLSVPAATGVLANDQGTTAGSQATQLTGPVHGTLALNPDGSFTYTPSANYAGADSFTYHVTDGTQTTEPATVSLTVTTANDPPVGVADSYTTAEDAALTVPAPGVLANDSDPDGNPITAVLVAPPAAGTLTLGATGAFTYTPPANFSGSASFTYRVSDGSLTSAPVTVSLTVTPVNDAPAAVADAYTVLQGGTLTVAAPGVLSNDTDVEAGPLTAVLAAGPASGTLTLAAGGGFTYTPNATFSGTDTFTYRASDGTLTSALATVTVTVTAVGPPPGLVAAYSFEEAGGATVLDRSGTGSTGTLAGAAVRTAAGRYGQALALDGVNDRMDVADQAALDLTTALTLEAWVYPTAVTGDWSTVILKERTGGLTYALYAQAPDAGGAPAAYLSIGGTDRRLAGTGVLPLNQWSHLAVTYGAGSYRLYVNGVQAASQALTGSIATSAGALRVGGNALWGEWFQGRVDEVRIYNRVLSQAEIQGDMAAPITPAGGNQAPVATADAYTVAQGGILTVPAPGVLGNDSDPDGNPITAVPGTNPANGSLALSANGSFTYTPNAGFSGSDTFTYTVSDGSLSSAPATVTISVTPGNRAPAGTADTYTVVQGGTLTIAAPGVLANDSDPDGNPITAVLGSNPTLGSLTLNANGGFTYSQTAAVGVPASDSFSYTVTDGTLSSAPVTVTINITAAGPPVGLVAAYSFEEASGTTVVDRSGTGNTGALSGGATRTLTGRYGQGLALDGVNDRMDVADSASLDLTTAMTLEAWVYPTALSGWRTVVMKEAAGGLAYALYAHDNAPRPAAYVNMGGADIAVPGTAQLALNAWTHLALTYDGASLRLYVNGALVRTQTQTGNIATTTGALRLGGNAPWGEWLQGWIDEVRIYNRALSPAEIQTDMNTAIP